MDSPRAIFNDNLPWHLKCAGTKAELAAMDEAEEWEGKSHVVIGGVYMGVVDITFTIEPPFEIQELDD